MKVKINGKKDKELIYHRCQEHELKLEVNCPVLSSNMNPVGGLWQATIFQP